MTTTAATIQHNLKNVQTRIDAACRRAGRDPAAVTLVAVVKYAEPHWVRALVDLGVRQLGESRPQQLIARAPEFDGRVDWHLVGHLQRNKARKLLPHVRLIHSVDSFRLLETLDRLAGEMGLTPRVLLQVNVAGEEQKHGFSPGELRDAWPRVTECRRVRVQGLMAMAPYLDDVESTRPFFRQLRELRERLRDAARDRPTLPELSMGMSRDFEIAVEEGATLVRIGSRLFEGLEKAGATED